MELDYEMRGISIGNSEYIRGIINYNYNYNYIIFSILIFIEVHNSFSRPECFLQENDKKRKSKETKDAYHFIAYIPFNGVVYE